MVTCILFIKSLFKLCPCFFFICVFFNLMLCHGKRGFCVNSYEYLIKFLSKSHELHSYIVYLKYHHVQLFLSMHNYVTGKGCLMSFTLVFFFFFYSQSKHFSISLRQCKIYVADPKPQTIISFFPIHTKMFYRKRGLDDKLKHKLYKC